MICAKAPLRLSFIGGGSDLPSFYKKSQGRVISATIDSYVYLTVHRTPLIRKVSVRYSVSETVDHPSHLKHTRVKAALLRMGIYSSIEINSNADLPAKTGLGSSSSFSVALIKALSLYRGEFFNTEEVAMAACLLEMELVGEPVGKQDQYAASYGGFNVFEFNSDGTVRVEPLFIDYAVRMKIEDHLVVLFTGLTRDASSVLLEQNYNLNHSHEKFQMVAEMADAVFDFKGHLLSGNVQRMGEMLHKTWLIKKTLSSNISNPVIDELYEVGMASGAWGGKILGAGGGGCIAFLAPNRDFVGQEVLKTARNLGLADCIKIPVQFSHDGVSVKKI